MRYLDEVELMVVETTGKQEVSPLNRVSIPSHLKTLEKQKFRKKQYLIGIVFDCFMYKNISFRLLVKHS